MITYRSDLFAKAGVKGLPKSLSQFQSDLIKVGAKEKKVKGFAPLYVGGEDWYTALGFVFDYNGSIAKYEHGKWVGTLDSTNSIKGLTAFQQFFDATQPKSSITAERHHPDSLHGVRTGQDRRELRSRLVQLLHRQELHEGHASSS